MARKQETTTICVSIEVWCKMNGLRKNPKESLNDIVREGILLLEEKRRL